jgi:ribosomal protein S27AE
MKLKMIKGVMLEKNTCSRCSLKMEYMPSSFEQYQPSEYKCQKCGYIASVSEMGYRNQAIDEQGEKEIELDEEKVFKIVRETLGEQITEMEWLEEGCKLITKAICSTLPEIIKVKE